MTACTQSLADERIRKIEQIIDGYRAGDANAAKALSQIEEVSSGHADSPIVRVGTPYAPELTTGGFHG